MSDWLLFTLDSAIAMQRIVNPYMLLSLHTPYMLLPLHKLSKSISHGNPEVSWKGNPGTVQFVGKVSFAATPMIGVQLDAPSGMHNGSLFGETYFSCPDKQQSPDLLDLEVLVFLLEESNDPYPQDCSLSKTRARGY